MRKNLSLLNEDLDETVELEYDVSDLDIDADGAVLRGTVTITKTVEDIAEDVLIDLIAKDEEISKKLPEDDDDAWYKYIDDNFDELFKKYESEIYSHYEEYAVDKVYDDFSNYEYTEDDYWADWADDHYYDDEY